MIFWSNQLDLSNLYYPVSILWIAVHHQKIISGYVGASLNRVIDDETAYDIYDGYELLSQLTKE